MNDGALEVLAAVLMRRDQPDPNHHDLEQHAAAARALGEDQAEAAIENERVVERLLVERRQVAHALAHVDGALGSLAPLAGPAASKGRDLLMRAHAELVSAYGVRPGGEK